MRHPCEECAFYEGSVWKPVDTGSVAVLAHAFRRKNLDEGQILFEQDSQNQGVYCVSKGLIALRTLHADGGSTLLKLAYPGDIIGFRSFLGSGRHKTEAHALLPSRVCIVAHRDANKVVHGNTSVLARFAARSIVDIDTCHERIIAAATTSNKKRLAELLHKLMAAHGVRVGDYMRMQLPLSRTDLADLIGVQPETMSRLFKRLQEDGTFVVSGRDIQVLLSEHNQKVYARTPL